MIAMIARANTAALVARVIAAKNSVNLSNAGPELGISMLSGLGRTIGFFPRAELQTRKKF